MIYGLHDEWNVTDEGAATVYTMAPDLIPASQTARVIYELRQDIVRLNDEVLRGVTS